MSLILTRIQTGFPIVSHPYAEIADKTGSSESQVIEEIASLKQQGVIRRIGAVFEPSPLGYVTTLAAAKVPADTVDAFSRAVSALPEVTHNYQRDHSWNLWFTLAAESTGQIENLLEILRRTFSVEILNLPVFRKYKLHVDFQPDTESANSPPAKSFSSPASALDPETVRFSEDQIRLVRRIQGDLSLDCQPFLPIAELLCWAETQVLDQIRFWIDGGVIRRFGAVVRHQNMGYVVNAMLVMRVSPDTIDAAGFAASAFSQVSHCYSRIAPPAWPYNLYAMIHAKSRQEMDQTAEDILRRIHPDSHLLLLTLREFKKTSMAYF